MTLSTDIVILLLYSIDMFLAIYLLWYIPKGLKLFTLLLLAVVGYELMMMARIVLWGSYLHSNNSLFDNIYQDLSIISILVCELIGSATTHQSIKLTRILQLVNSNLLKRVLFWIEIIIGIDMILISIFTVVINVIPKNNLTYNYIITGLFISSGSTMFLSFMFSTSLNIRALTHSNTRITIKINSRQIEYTLLTATVLVLITIDFLTLVGFTMVSLNIIAYDINLIWLIYWAVGTHSLLLQLILQYADRILMMRRPHLKKNPPILEKKLETKEIKD